MSTKLEQSREQSIQKMAEINKCESINKVTQYFQDYFTMHGILDISPVSIAEKIFNYKKSAGQLNELNLPITV